VFIVDGKIALKPVNTPVVIVMPVITQLIVNV
jgi:hypothetical protein